MKKELTIDLAIPKQELEKVEQLTNLLLTDREAFRTKATTSYSLFPPENRVLCEVVATKDVGMYDVLVCWETKLQPLRMLLEAKRAEPALCKALMKHLVLEEDEAQAEIEQLVTKRQEEVLRACVDELFPACSNQRNHYAQQKAQALTFLSQPDELIAIFQQRYLDFHLYRHIATKHDVAVYDPFAPWFARKRLARRVRKDRNKAEKQATRRLRHIEQRLKELETAQSGLLNHISTKGWDLIRVIDLRNQFEKKIKALSATEAKSATKRLAIFDEVTREFRDLEIEKLSHAHAGLASLRTLSEEIDKLLLHLFDLNNTQKNQLMLQMKEYRLLRQEQDKITAQSSNRKQLQKAGV